MRELVNALIHDGNLTDALTVSELMRWRELELLNDHSISMIRHSYWLGVSRTLCVVLDWLAGNGGQLEVPSSTE